MLKRGGIRVQRIGCVEKNKKWKGSCGRLCGSRKLEEGVKV